MKIKLFIFALLILSNYSCTKDLDFDLTNQSLNTVNQNNNAEKSSFVPEKLAISVAEKFSVKSKTRNPNSNVKLNVKTIYGAKSNPLMYIINFSDNRFVIIGATKNYYPILAYSDKNSFSEKQKSGVTKWIKEIGTIIASSENFNKKIKNQMLSQWESYVQSNDFCEKKATRGMPEEDKVMHNRINELRNAYPDYDIRPLSTFSPSMFPINGDIVSQELRDLATKFNSPIEYTICAVKREYSSKIVGPFLTTKWGQDYPYNALLEDNLAGCVTIAMAQIMKYHKFPPQYNWDNMQDDAHTDNPQDLPKLIRDIAVAAKVKLGTSGSSSNIYKAKDAFCNIFNYSARIENYTLAQTQRELIKNKYPIYMRGEEDETGHAWVCDGTRQDKEEMFYFIECREGYPGKYSYRSIDGPSPKFPGYAEQDHSPYFHMNWGWYGANDGWFRMNDVNPNTSNLSKNRKNLYVYPNR
jgi:hypothetical protein